MKVVLVTFGGRERSLKTLFEYVILYKEHFDEYHIYVATTNSNDIAFMENFAKNNSFVKLKYTMKDGVKILDDKCFIWDNAYKNCMEDDTLYLKLDDDIVYMDKSLFTTFLDFCKENPQIPLIFPTIINNAFSSWNFERNNIYNPHLKSRIGENWKTAYESIKDMILSNKGINYRIGDLVREENILCPVAWGNLQYCVDLHMQFINDVKNNNVEKYKSPNWILENCEPMSIACVCWNGGTLKKLVAEYGDIKGDEPWWTIFIPTWSGKRNVVFGGAVVSHYSYYRQRELGLDDTNILELYYDILPRKKSIGAFFQCHKQPTATYNTLLNFRKSYPTSSIILLSDNGYNYQKMADHFQAIYIHSNENLGVAFGENKIIKDISRFSDYLSRLKNALNFIHEDYFMWLEDDVLVKKPYTEAFLGTINGNCVNSIPSSIFNKIEFYNGDSSDKFYTGHGGSVYNKKQFLDILQKEEISWLINNWEKILGYKTLDNDFFFCVAMHTLGGSVYSLNQHKDGIHSDANVIHQWKELYDIEPDENIIKLFNR